MNRSNPGIVAAVFWGLAVLGMLHIWPGGLFINFISMLLVVAFVLWFIQSPEFLIAVLVLGQFLSHFLVSLIADEPSRNRILDPGLLAVFGTIGVVYAFKHLSGRGVQLTFPEKRAAALVLAIGILLVISSWYAPVPDRGITKAIKYANLNAFPFFVVFVGVRSRDMMRRLILILVYLGAVKCILTLAGLVQAGSFEYGLRLGEGRQILGFYLNSGIWFGRQVTVAFLSATIATYFTRGHLQKGVLVGFAAFFCFMVLFAGSRGPVVSLVAILPIIYALLYKRRLVRAILLSAAVMLFVVAMFQSLPDHLQTRFSTEKITDPRGSFHHRVRLYTLGVELFLENPILGVGTTGFNYYNAPYEKSTSLSGVWNYVHNIFLELAADHGIVGLLLLCVLLFIFLRASWQCYFHSQYGTEQFYVSVWIMSILLMALANAQFSGDINTNEYIWIAGALAMRNRALMLKESAEAASVVPSRERFRAQQVAAVLPKTSLTSNHPTG